MSTTSARPSLPGNRCSSDTALTVSEAMNPLHILMVLPMPWSPELGAPRVSIELAEELRSRGHLVDKYDLDDAFPKRSRLSGFFESALFPRRAAAYVRKHGRRYDVVEAEQGFLPYTKKELNFDGVLVVRSSGLWHFYDAWMREAARTHRSRLHRRGTIAGNCLRWIAGRMWGVPTVERSLETADAVIVINRDEQQYVSRRLGHGAKCHLIPHGLSERTFQALSAAALPPAARLAQPQVVFVGHWGERKGSQEFPEFVRLLRRSIPEVRFLLLGTHVPPVRVLEPMDPDDRGAVDVVPHFCRDELPGLLKQATVGVLPSYIEGFPLGLLEQLAARIPSMAYDVPGPRETLRLFSRAMLVERGNVTDLATLVGDLLRLPEADYVRLSSEAEAIARRFRWSDSADRLLQVYLAARQHLGYCS